MDKIHIGVVVGSLRKDSFNRRFARALEKLAPREFTFRHLEIGDLPLYNQDDDANPHAAVKRLKQQVREVQALLFVTPEYNRSIPGVLKNALDHASRPYGQNAWAGKPAAVIGVSGGAVGTAIAQQHLRTILAYLDVPTLNQPEAFIQWKDDLVDASGTIGEGSRKFLQQWMDRFASFIRSHVGAGREETAEA